MYLNKKQKAKTLGELGEQYVSDYLRKNGYIIIRRNWHDKRFGEIDIVAENKECIAFVEVKTRQKHALVSGAEAVDIHKQRKIKNASQMFMKKLRTTLPARIDVAELVVENETDGEYNFSLNYIKSAF